MSMSMSMSYSTGTGGGSGGGGRGGGGGGSSPWSTTAPTDAPTSNPPIDGVDGSSAPSMSSAPSATESSVPSASPTVATPQSGSLLFECTDQGVDLAGTPGLVTTPISLTILYEAESTEDSTDGFLADLERALFSIALTAALECDGTTRRELHEATRKLATASSSVVGTYTMIHCCCRCSSEGEFLTLFIILQVLATLTRTPTLALLWRPTWTLS